MYIAIWPSYFLAILSSFPFFARCCVGVQHSAKGSAVLPGKASARHCSRSSSRRLPARRVGSNASARWIARLPHWPTPGTDCTTITVVPVCHGASPRAKELRTTKARVARARVDKMEHGCGRQDLPWGTIGKPCNIKIQHAMSRMVTTAR